MIPATAHSFPAWQAVAQATGISRGTAALDVGCGTGGFCELAFARGAIVSGIDAAAGAIEAARRRVPEADFRVGAMERLPWGDGTFDVVTGFNSFQYADDVGRALAEAGRVARPRGCVAICKWGRPEDNELFVLLGALHGVASAPASSASAGPDPMEHAAARAGLRVMEAHEVDVFLELPTDAALQSALRAAAPATALDRLAPHTIRQRVLDAALPFQQPDGSYRLKNRFRYLIARP